VAIIGRYILSQKIFGYLERQTEGAGGEIQLTDAIQAMTQQTPITGFRYEGTRFDCGTKSGWLEANLAFAYTQPDLWPGLQEVIQKYCLPAAA
jgi:UTP--glucose-1-phosphate uridylyltransferase